MHYTTKSKLKDNNTTSHTSLTATKLHTTSGSTGCSCNALNISMNWRSWKLLALARCWGCTCWSWISWRGSSVAISLELARQWNLQILMHSSTQISTK